MSRLQEFLDSLEDYELGAFYKYRFDSFMSGSSQKIIKELEKRRINPTQIDRLIEQAKETIGAITDKEYCPRCYSKHFYLSSETDFVSMDLVSVELHNRFKTCLVCLYSQDKSDYVKKKRRIWTKLGLISKRNIK